MVGLVPSKPRDRPSRPVCAVDGARQAARIVGALRTTERLKVAATRLAERVQFRTVRLIIGNIRRCVLRNSAGIRTRSERPRAPDVLEAGEDRVRATGWVRIADLGPVEPDCLATSRKRPPD